MRIFRTCVSAFCLTAGLFGQTAASSEVNRGLPGWLRFNGEERVRMETLGGVGFRSVRDSYLLNRLRLHMEVRPVKWLKFDFEAQDSRVFGQNTRPAPASQKDAMDLRIATVEVGTIEDPVQLHVGRQALSFGEGRVVADPNWSNVGRSFDAARVTLRRGGWKVDLFSGAAVKVSATDLNERTPRAHFHGAYGSLGKMVPKAALEPYVLWRLENAAGVRLDEKTVGFRWTGTLPWGFDYGSEVAGQTGSADADRVRAWAGHWVAGHTLPDARHKPRLFAEFNRASGDGNSRDGVRRGFDPLFPSTHDKLGVTDLFTWTNLLHWRNGFEYTVRPSIKVGVAYNSFWLADGRDGLYSGGKAVARRADGTAGTHIGQQGDLQATWTAPLGTQVSGGYGRLFAGEFLRQTTAGYAYNVFFCAIGRRF